MASPFTHAVVGATLAAVHHVRPAATKVCWVAMACAVAPDIDALGYWLGVPYDSFWGHRGFTHSIAFAALLGGLCVWWIGASAVTSRVCLWSVCSTATVSHGMLDAMTDGGLGVAFFSPVDQGRYFFPVRPIHVSSMSPRDLLGPHGFDVLTNEILWVWIPCALTVAILWWGTRKRLISSSE